MSDEVNVFVAENPLVDVLVSEQEIVLIPINEGIPGKDAGFITKTASGAIGGNRVVRVAAENTVVYADASETGNTEQILGVTTAAASDGASVTVQTTGEMTEPSWVWTVGGPIYLGTAGVLTQVCPSTGAVIRIGVATAATKMLINLGSPIILY